MRYAHPEAGRYDYLHGDEDWGRELTPSEEVEIEQRASELVKERLADYERFADLMGQTEHADLYSHLHRMMQNYESARKAIVAKFSFDYPPSIEGFMSAFDQIDRLIKREADIVWGDECTTEAEIELGASDE